MAEIRLLLVEPDPERRRRTAQQLRRREFQVTMARSGAQALTLSRASVFDAVVANLSAVAAEADQVIEGLRAALPQSPILLLTPRKAESRALAAIARGAYQFLFLPVSIDNLELTIRLAVEHQRLRRRLQTHSRELERKTDSLERRTAELSQALRELEASRDELQAVFDSSHSLLLFVDNADCIVSCNPRVREYFGLSPEDVAHRPFTEFIGKVGRLLQNPENAERALSDPAFYKADQMSNDDAHAMFRRAWVVAESQRVIAPWVVDVTARDGHKLGRFWGFSDITGVKQADDHIHAVIEAAPIPLIITRFPEGTILFANERMSSIVGLKPKDLVGRRAPEFYADPSERENLLKELTATGRAQQEMRVRHVDGSEIWMIFMVALAEINRQKVIIGGLYDISERKSIEEQLRRERNFVAAVINTVDALIIVLDTEGRIVQFNRACESISGYESFETRGRFVWDFLLPPEEVAAVQAAFADVRAQTLSGTFTNHWLTRDGRKRLIEWSNTVLSDADGKIEYVIGTGIDVTEERAALEALRVSEERFRTIVENANDIIYLLDDDGVFRYVSPNWTQWLGHEVAEVVGQPFSDFVHPDDRQLCQECFIQILTSQRRLSGIEHRVRHKNGSYRWHNTSASPLPSASGRSSQYVGISHDVTERKKTQDELAAAYKDLKSTQSQLVQSEKMASLGMLVAGIAHEINTPIGAVASMHDTLVRAVDKLTRSLDCIGEQSGADTESIAETLRLIEDANRVIVSGTERVVNIVRRLRSFARLDEAEIKRIDIHEGLEDTLTLIHHEIKHNIKLERRFGAVPRLACYPGRLNQVFLNLLINAKQAIVDKGTITITTGTQGIFAFIEFADSGVGIPPENLQRIFDPGFTTKGVGVGTGLGLSICYQIVRDHRGTIEVASEVGVGTTFRVLLPLNLDEILGVSAG